MRCVVQVWASPALRAKAAGPAGSCAAGWTPPPRLTRTSVRSPAAHRRTRHLNDIYRACQPLPIGDNVRQTPTIHLGASCPQRLVRLGVLCEKSCQYWVCGQRTKSVVHCYSQRVHRLSTDLSFVDNFRAGVQSRSNNESRPVSGLRQGPAVGPHGGIAWGDACGAGQTPNDNDAGFLARGVCPARE